MPEGQCVGFLWDGGRPPIRLALRRATAHNALWRQQGVLLLSPAEGALLRSPPQFSLWYPRYAPSAIWQCWHGYVSTLSLPSSSIDPMKWYPDPRQKKHFSGFACAASSCTLGAEVKDFF
jgi:hypothetical protein